MPNLKDWIEAQLKRGYSRMHIKAVLKKHGYPPKAVAEVDRLGFSNLPKNKIPKRNASLILFLIVIVAIIDIVYFTNSITNYFTDSIPKSAAAAKAMYPACEKFSGSIAECENAVRLSLTRYSGSITSVDKKTISFNAEEFPEGNGIQADAWVVEIHLNQPLEMPLEENTPQYKASDIEVAVDTAIENILLVKAKELAE